ncbi:MAG: hypothetical protein HY077_15425 [Elusimicrobia bacterium]|nr:hypothetical protein [Elusimicrobiota bacterium]
MRVRQIRPVDALAESIAYLGSAHARADIEADPYWPKWDSPWWHMTLLWELGRAPRIPASAVEAMTEALKTRYAADLPFRAEDLPPGKGIYRDVACHCAVGTMFQVLFACGVELDDELPWMRRWLLRYQLPDGGLNCEGEAYVGSKKSSIVSTAPALEAVLLCTPRPFTAQEEAFLDRGAKYLIDHRVFKSSRGKVIDPDWLKLTFPRFYKYDALRGLTYLARWSKKRNRSLPADALGEAREAVEGHVHDGQIRIGRRAYGEQRSLLRDGNGWIKGMSRSFDLLDQVSEVGRPSAPLTRLWAEIGPSLGS